MTQPLSPTDHRRQCLASVEGVVVKVGTRVLTTPSGQLDLDRIDALATGLCEIADTGRQTILVSSGAVGAGIGKLELAARPAGLAQLQAVAAVGQADLIQAYEKSLSRRGRHAAQVLLTASDLKSRSAYLNVRNALTQIDELGAIAIVNENDSVAVSELMTTFGDNDRLAAQVAGLVPQAMLVILSDVDGLFDGSPDDPASKKVEVVESIDSDVRSMAQVHRGTFSKGGMASKLDAASTATSHGHPTIIAPGKDDQVLQKIMDCQPVGTLFLPNPDRAIRGRRRWIGSAADVEGILTIDQGAAEALLHRGSSLLAIGITSVSGVFGQGSVVELKNADGKCVARGLCNYPSDEVDQIRGAASEKISDILGHRRPYECVVHRDNLVLTESER